MCETLDSESLSHGVRIFVGQWTDAYLGRFPVRPGYTYVVWKGRHVAEPTELSTEEAAGFWSEVARVAAAVERRYQPAKMNWNVLGNGVPHLHVHLIPRPDQDAMAGGPIESDAFELALAHPVDDEVLAAEADALRGMIEH